jgi:cell shape-determining protein MreD
MILSLFLQDFFIIQQRLNSNTTKIVILLMSVQSKDVYSYLLNFYLTSEHILWNTWRRSNYLLIAN